MQRVVSDKLGVLTDLCRKHGVRRLELFGSATTHSFDAARSDLDFLVEFVPQPRRGLDDVYFRLMRDLEELFGRSVHLVEEGCIQNPIVKASVDRSKVPLYAAA
jgi:predicted nucleotidyltransferase